MSHFKDRGFETRVDTKGTVVIGRDHFVIFEDLIEVFTTITIVRTRCDICQRIERIVIDFLTSADFRADISVEALLLAV